MRNKVKTHPFSSYSTSILVVLDSAMKKERKRIHIGKEETKLSLFVDYIENFLEVIKEYIASSQDTRSMYKSLLLLYVPAMKKMELGIKNIMLFTIGQKMKYVGINLTKCYRIHMQITSKHS